MSRRSGNKGQRARKPVLQPPPPKLWDCKKHGVQRGVGIAWKGKCICMECMWEFLEDNCCLLTELGEKPNESS